MVIYNFYLGTAHSGQQSVLCETDEMGRIVGGDLSSTSSESGGCSSGLPGTSSSGLNTGDSSMNVLYSSSGEGGDGVVYHTIQDISRLYEEIIDFITNYEISKIEVNTGIDEDKILSEIIDKLGYVYEDVSDDDDSDNLFGYSDILSVSSDSVFDLNRVSSTYQEIVDSIYITEKILYGIF
jgi:hypothetical protein